MLPNQSSDLPIGYHRRQTSTPTVPIAPKVPLFPATQPRHDNHRRGLSLDQGHYNDRPQETSQQDETTVSIDQGLQQIQQHTLREAQQQHSMARPGQTNDQETLIQRKNNSIYIKPAPEQGFSVGNITGNDFSNPLSDSKNDLLDFINEYQSKTNNLCSHPTNSAGYLEGLGNETDVNSQDNTRTTELNAFEMLFDDGLPRRELVRPSTPVNSVNTSEPYL